MALFVNLPVYKLGYDLLLEIFTRTKIFAREYKYTLGEKLKAEAIELLINVYKANKARKQTRIAYIDHARQNVEVVRLLLRLCKDLKIIGVKGYVLVNNQVEELSKQLTAWQKYTAGAKVDE